MENDYCWGMNGWRKNEFKIMERKIGHHRTNSSVRLNFTFSHIYFFVFRLNEKDQCYLQLYCYSYSYSCMCIRYFVGRKAIMLYVRHGKQYVLANNIKNKAVIR